MNMIYVHCGKIISSVCMECTLSKSHSVTICKDGPFLSLLKVPSDGSCAIAHLPISITVSCQSSLVSNQLAVPFYAFFEAERTQVSRQRSRSHEEQ